MSDAPNPSAANADPPAEKPQQAAAPVPPRPPVKSRPAQAAKSAPPAAASALTSGPAEPRRDFFSGAMRETLGPLAFLLERKINPLLAALEAIPDEVERLTHVSLPGILDQPQSRHAGIPPALDPQQSVPLRVLRPPGAMAPGEFETVCSRCGKCAEACPAEAIKLDPQYLIAEGLPYIAAAQKPCVVCDSLACMHSCPTGALKLVDRLKIKMGTARVDPEMCLRERGEDCRLCVEACPITGDGKSPAGEAIFIHAESGRIRVRKNICVGCGLCESRCPTEPRAIFVEPARGFIDPIIA